MSWQATAWAERQKTGSPARKVLLLVLGNYADEDGYCWPSQKTLSRGTEQSVDTVRRNANRLQSDRFIDIEQKPRKGGRWPKLAYKLRMFTGPQNAARSEPVDNVSPSRTSNDHRAAPATITGPHQQRSPGRIAGCHEYLNTNIQSEPSSEPPPTASALYSEPRARRRATERKKEPAQAVQNRIVDRLGQGDVAKGWLLFGALDALDRKYLERCERGEATCDDALFAEYLSAAEYRLSTPPADRE